MAYIYQITNDINDKIYIGKTEFDIQKRFKEHCRDAFKRFDEKRPLYSAMRKYGIEHFRVELIEETDNPDERETYWIEKKESFLNGYNATLGGDGAKYIDEELVIQEYLISKIQAEVAKKLNVDVKSVHQILVKNNIPIEKISQLGNKIKVYDLNNNFIKSFETQHEAARWIIANNKTTSIDIKRTAGNIGRAVDQKKRQTAYGYKWYSLDSSIEFNIL